MTANNHIENDQWTVVKITEEVRKSLIRDVIRGEIDRSKYPDLWPPDFQMIDIKVTWPTDTND